MSTDVQIQRLDPHVELPRYARSGDAGADLVSTIDVAIAPGERALVPTGIAIALPPGFAAFVHPRSGLALRHGLSIVNTPGTIDAGYRGEIKVVLINHDRHETVSIHRGDRIAQLVVQRVEHVRFVDVPALPVSERGEGGYGSSGGHASLTPAREVREER
ncbi:dUTP diphosphatase [uncultured Aeromicrobium sp.]|uniref:dUTP diphosphatase n=1 Tax=uncultured Aeromicrobium sp. TaxID=337820 RepID=UPI0025EBBFE3|nr:dUTP diphosphatase [uncultured Aeromicrobium sp.]